MPDANVFIDDWIVGSTAYTEEELIKVNYKTLQHLHSVFAENRLVCNPFKIHFFEQELEC